MLFVETISQEILAAHREQLDRAERLYSLGRQTLANAMTSGKADEKSFLAWLFLARASTALRSVINLFILGSEMDANTVFRTIVELAIDYEYVWTGDTASLVKQYLDHQFIVQHRRDEVMRKVFPNEDHEAISRARFADPLREVPSFPHKTYEEYQKHLDAEYDRVVALDKHGRFSWTKLSVANRIRGPKEITYDLLYGLMGCDASHSGAGMLAGIHAAPVGDPQKPLGATVIYAAALIYIKILIWTTQHFDLTMEPVDVLNQELNNAPVAAPEPSNV